jgi:oligosaccharyltransferase complex subunit alpha (ribophorin I)
MSSFFPLSLLLFLVTLSSSSVTASVPQLFHNTNLLRTIDLTKPYIRDTTAVIIENISNTTQTEYLWGIPLSLASKMSYLEAREKKAGVAPKFAVEKAVEEHSYVPQLWTVWLTGRTLQLYKIGIPSLAPGEKIPLMIVSAYVDCLIPYPTIVDQDANQYLLYFGERCSPSLYTTLKQKTKLK